MAGQIEHEADAAVPRADVLAVLEGIYEDARSAVTAPVHHALMGAASRLERLLVEHNQVVSSLSTLSKVEQAATAFVAQREEYVRVLKQCVNADADYHRWQGHAEARRQLGAKLEEARS